MRKLFFLLLLSQELWAQAPPAPADLRLLGTRSWIRLQWKDNAANESGYNIYWAATDRKPAKPSAVLAANSVRYYIQPVKEQTRYFIWIEAFNANGTSSEAKGAVVTTRQWALDSAEARRLDIPSSAAVPEGMELFWHDEFNDTLLNRNKWFTTYYSSIDFLRKDNLSAMLADSLPQAAYRLNGSTITLFTNDTLPARAFYPAAGRKISSIQTYDWRLNENLLDNSRGGYFEVRVKRSYTGRPKGLNTAFWFDSPGPDLKYYLEAGSELNGTKGIRPRGQVFEIDVFENLDAQFVLHGHVDRNGRFVHNLATHIAEGYTHENNWVVHGMLWTPTSIKHYINGRLIKAYTDKHQVYSPNHFMNVFLGSYGAGGSVSMEVDYIRGYTWPLSNGNELPNPGFEANTTLLPWEGSGTLSAGEKRSGGHGLVLAPGQEIAQYVYLDNHTPYELAYWAKGTGSLQVSVDNVKLVSGELETAATLQHKGEAAFARRQLRFRTGREYGKHMKTIRLYFRNTGNAAIVLDDISISKQKQ